MYDNFWDLLVSELGCIGKFFASTILVWIVMTAAAMMCIHPAIIIFGWIFILICLICYGLKKK